MQIFQSIKLQGSLSAHIGPRHKHAPSLLFVTKIVNFPVAACLETEKRHELVYFNRYGALGAFYFPFQVSSLGEIQFIRAQTNFYICHNVENKKLKPSFSLQSRNPCARLPVFRSRSLPHFLAYKLLLRATFWLKSILAAEL